MSRWSCPLNVFRIHAIATCNDTRGVVLPLALFTLMLLGALVATLLSVGAMESQISANLLRGTQAFDLAEAGAERAIAQFVANPSTVANVTWPGSTVNSLFTAQALSGLPTALQNPGTYTVTWQPVGPATVLIKSTGQSAAGKGNDKQTVQVVVTVPPGLPPYAILADDVQMSGSATVSGALGAVHGNTNGSLTGTTNMVVPCRSGALGSVQGNTNDSITGTAHVSQTATSASATCTGCTDAARVGNVAGSGPNKPTQTLPTLSALDYKQYADYILGDDGTITDGKTGALLATCGLKPGCTTGPFAGWSRHQIGNPGDWHYDATVAGLAAGTTPPDGTYYSSWELSIDSSPGSSATPWKATLITGSATLQGELEIGGNPTIVPYYQDLLGVGGATKLTGLTANLTGTVISTTKSRPRLPTTAEPVVMSGGTLKGQILTDGIIQVSGNAQIINNPTSWSNFSALQVLSWIRVPQ